MAFGDRLAEVRRGHGLTQEQFAEQLQVSRQAVSKWESGRGYPEIEKILYICNCVVDLALRAFRHLVRFFKRNAPLEI